MWIDSKPKICDIYDTWDSAVFTSSKSCLNNGNGFHSSLLCWPQWLCQNCNRWVYVSSLEFSWITLLSLGRSFCGLGHFTHILTWKLEGTLCMGLYPYWTQNSFYSVGWHFSVLLWPLSLDLKMSRSKLKKSLDQFSLYLFSVTNVLCSCSIFSIFAWKNYSYILSSFPGFLDRKFV